MLRLSTLSGLQENRPRIAACALSGVTVLGSALMDRGLRLVRGDDVGACACLAWGDGVGWGNKKVCHARKALALFGRQEDQGPATVFARIERGAQGRSNLGSLGEPKRV